MADGFAVDRAALAETAQGLNDVIRALNQQLLRPVGVGCARPGAGRQPVREEAGRQHRQG
jgi:hypothetical protein